MGEEQDEGRNRECSLNLQFPMLVTGLKELEMLLDDLFEYKNRDIYGMRVWVKNTMKKEGKKHIFKDIHINLEI
jgi:predicted phosphohydrolase